MHWPLSLPKVSACAGTPQGGRRRVVLTLKKLTDRPISDIEELLAGEAAPPA
jgi:hypothetical protein